MLVGKEEGGSLPRRIPPSDRPLSRGRARNHIYTEEGKGKGGRGGGRKVRGQNFDERRARGRRFPPDEVEDRGERRRRMGENDISVRTFPPHRDFGGGKKEG